VVEAKWIEVSLIVKLEQADAVADAFNQIIPNGVVIEQNVIQQAGCPENHLESQVRIFGYLLVDGDLEKKKEKIEVAVWHLGQIQPLPLPVFTPIQEEDWMSAWKKQYQPIEIGERLVILPAWVEKKVPGRIPIRINPGMAFGTGAHPSTQLCLSLMEEIVQSGIKVIDVGCGSGILSIAAIRLGAGRVLAVDIDSAALRSTRENAAINLIQDELEIGQGSVKEILAAQFGFIQAHLVVVNILANTILQLFVDGLADLVCKGGQLLLAGILEEQTARIIQCAKLQPMTLERKMVSSDWAALLLKKNN